MLKDILTSALGGLAASLCYIAVWGGKMDSRMLAQEKWHDEIQQAGGATQMRVNTAKILDMDANGTRALKAHDDMDDVRVKDLERRIGVMEQLAVGFGEMRGDVRVIRTKVDAIEQQLFNGTNNGKIK